MTGRKQGPQILATVCSQPLFVVLSCAPPESSGINTVGEVYSLTFGIAGKRSIYPSNFPGISPPPPDHNESWEQKFDEGPTKSPSHPLLGVWLPG